jgi:hypothetical protein
MQYMITINTEPYPAPAPGEPGFEEYMNPWLEFNRAHGEALVAGGELQPAETATTVRRTFGGGDTIVDGPFAETKEALAGFYVVEAADLDAALAIVAAMPIPAGAFEVRPLARDIQR